jgi:Ca2+-binding EF-hand superfamily protein
MDIESLFRYYVQHNDDAGRRQRGELNFEEFRRAARKDAKLTKQDVSDDGLRKLFDHVNTDKSGTIGLEEFQQLLEGDMSPRDEARGTDPTARPVHAGPTQRRSGSSGENAAAKRQRQRSAGVRVLVRLQNFPTERALKALHKFDPDETGEVPVEAFLSVCKGLGLATDQTSVLLREYSRSELSSGPSSTVKYKEFIQHLITPLGEVQAQEQLQKMLKLAQQPPDGLLSHSGSLSSEQGDRETERAPSVSTAGATMAESEISRRLLEQIHGLSEDERTLSLELWKRCEELEQEVKASRRQLSEGGEEMVAESQQLMRQMREYQQQCKRETGESLTMVVESRRMLSLVTKEKDQVSQERDALAAELADLKLQLAKATVRIRELLFSWHARRLLREEGTGVCNLRWRRHIVSQRGCTMLFRVRWRAGRRESDERQGEPG